MGTEVRGLLSIISNSPAPGIALTSFGVALLLTLSVAVTQNVYTWIDAKPPEGIASIDVWKMGMVTGTAGTATAFLVTLFVAERNYRRSREHIPHLSMRLRVRRVPVSKTYDVVVATLRATNNGTGLCIVDKIYWDLKVLAPYDDAVVESLESAHKEAEPNDYATEFPWHQREEDVSPAAFQIEPGETEETTHDFIIPEEIEAIVVSAWVRNAFDEGDVAKGWHRRTVHTQELGGTVYESESGPESGSDLEQRGSEETRVD